MNRRKKLIKEENKRDKEDTCERYEQFIRRKDGLECRSEQGVKPYSGYGVVKNVGKAKYNAPIVERKPSGAVTGDFFSDSSMDLKKRMEMGARVKAMAKFRQQNYSDLSLTFKSIELPSISETKCTYSVEKSQQNGERNLASQGFLDFSDILAETNYLKKSTSTANFTPMVIKEKDIDFVQSTPIAKKGAKWLNADIKDLKYSPTNFNSKSKFYCPSPLKLPEIKSKPQSKGVKKNPNLGPKKPMRRTFSSRTINNPSQGILSIMGKCDSLLDEKSQ
ncbi:unnamed protein product [Moneuplotes crassus]|uniref:Uncharacterized protein n=1 Tax=Euplotes crassus TaxID=5936 RepID=A0AAD1XIC8_EUPCR|nr:unnamed protein product [Moneuplotes crassus]